MTSQHSCLMVRQGGFILTPPLHGFWFSPSVWIWLMDQNRASSCQETIRTPRTDRRRHRRSFWLFIRGLWCIHGQWNKKWVRRKDERLPGELQPSDSFQMKNTQNFKGLLLQSDPPQQLIPSWMHLGVLHKSVPDREELSHVTQISVFALKADQKGSVFTLTREQRSLVNSDSFGICTLWKIQAVVFPCSVRGRASSYLWQSWTDSWNFPEKVWARGGSSVGWQLCRIEDHAHIGRILPKRFGS